MFERGRLGTSLNFALYTRGCPQFSIAICRLILEIRILKNKTQTTSLGKECCKPINALGV